MLLSKGTYSNSCIHTLMAVMAAMKGADKHIKSSLGFSILPKDTSTCRLGEPAPFQLQDAGSTPEPQPLIVTMIKKKKENSNYKIILYDMLVYCYSWW